MLTLLETVRQAYDAWQGGDSETFLGRFDSNVVFDLTSFPEGAVYTGREGLLEGWRRWRGTWERYEVAIEDLRGAGDRVLALTRVEAVSKGHNVETMAEGADLWTVRDGLVVHLAIYLDRADVPLL